MDQKVVSSSRGIVPMEMARRGAGILTRLFEERPLLFLGVGLAAAAALVARLNARRLAGEAIRSHAAAEPHVPSRPAPKKGRSGRHRARKPARRTKRPAQAA